MFVDVAIAVGQDRVKLKRALDSASVPIWTSNLWPSTSNHNLESAGSSVSP